MLTYGAHILADFLHLAIFAECGPCAHGNEVFRQNKPVWGV